jgi:Flp pilus assembly protein TadD
VPNLVAKLREAVRAEDALPYSEPPDWILPARHSLGAALMQERRFAEAEQVYRDDLARLPENGWSLFGLAQSLHRQGKEEEAAPIIARFQKIGSKADVQIKSSCLCQPGV